MNAPKLEAFDHQEWITRALSILALRLRHEVALHRALRGEAGREGFAGVLLDGDEAETILEAMAGRLQASGTAEPLRAIEAMEEQLSRSRRDAGSIWHQLTSAFELSEPELDVIFLAAAPGLDPRFGRIYGFLGNDLGRRYLTPALLSGLLARHNLNQLQFRQLMAPDNALRHHGLIRLGPDRPRAEAPIRLDEDMLDRLLGASPALPATLISPSGIRNNQAAPKHPRLIELPDNLGHRDIPDTALADFADSSGLTLLPVASRTLLRHDKPVQALLRQHRAARLAGAHLVLTESASDGAPLNLTERLRLLPALAPGIFVLSHDTLGWHDAGLPADDSRPTPAAMTRQIAALDGLAEPLRHGFQLRDLILPPRSTAALADLTDAARSLNLVVVDWGMGGLFGKSAGLTALFKGPSGTGKTMAAQALANCLGRKLYRVDLAGLISKYIGETEKHLNRLFSAAQGLDIVLLFDEADAVFGKRSEVNDAHDRHANTGTAYLLQRLETHRGMSILTTNLQENIDEAFLRRIDAVIDFPAPGPAERYRLWQRIGRSSAPLDERLDLKMLATLELTGGEIRNCCLTAAYRAAARHNSIGMDTLMRAAALELAKKGKPVRRTDFGDFYAQCKGGT